MLASTTTANRRASQPKHKAACDQCNASKVKCPGGTPRCKRCADSCQPCHYSLARRFGKPPGSKNRKTLEGLRQAKERNLENNKGAGSGWSISQNNRESGDGALDGESEPQGCDEHPNQFQMSRTTSFLPISPLNSYPSFPDESQFLIGPQQDFLDDGHEVILNDGDESAFHCLDPNFSEVEGLKRAESRRTWADDQDEYCNSSSPSIDQQLSSGPADTNSLLSEYSHSSTSETQKLISLDTVAARLEETAVSITHFEQRQQMLCQCLRKYSDVLCQLQTIQKRQRPVQVDTFLTCANLVLNIAKAQLECGQCLYDSCVAMQLVMIFQTIFTWSQDQCHPTKSPGREVRLTLGQHEMTEDECTLVKTALTSRILERASTLLKLMTSRIEHVALNRQGKQLRDYEGGEFWNLQSLAKSLTQNFGNLSKMLELGQRRSGYDTEL